MSRAARVEAGAVAAALTLAAFVAGLFPIFDGDLFWHLASGRWIVEHGAVPRADPFRFSAEGLPWVDHEWLFQVVVYEIERAVGLDGVIVARAAALAGFGLLLFAAARRAGLGAGLAGLFALGAVLGVRPRFLDRPEIVTLFAIVLFLSILEASRDERIPSKGRSGGAGSVAPGIPARQLFGSLAVTVVWVNFHGEALLAPGLAGLSLLGSALDERAEGGSGTAIGAIRRRWREWLGVPVLLGLALLVNPYGWRIFLVPVGIRAALSELGAVNPEWLSAFRAPQPYLFGGLAVVGVLAIAARLEQGRWVALRWGLPALALSGVALGAVRHQALFYAAAAPYAAHCLGSLSAVKRAAGDRPTLRRLAAACGVVALLAGLWAAFPPSTGPLRARHGGLRLGLGLAEGRFPVRMTDLLAASPGARVGPLYNEFLHGGYLLWRLHPPRRVFHDGRMELEPGLLRELVAARRSPESWSELLRRRGAVGALVRYEARRVPVLEAAPGAAGASALRQVDARTPNDLLFAPELWDLVEWDDEAMLFLARGAHAWPGEPYRFARPEDPERALRRAAVDPAFRAGLEAELERKLAGQPDCRRARRWLRELRGAEGGAAPGDRPAGASGSE